MNIDEIISTVLAKKYNAFFYTPPFYKDSFSYIFSTPARVLSAKTKIELEQNIKMLEEYLGQGLVGYCLLSYEASYFSERILTKLYEGKEEVFVSVLFDNVIKIKSKDINHNFDCPHLDFSISGFGLNVSENQYLKNINKIKRYIEEGDTYQVNYTVKGTFQCKGDYSAFVKNLIFNQSSKYSALINCCSKLIISLSPELFFSIDNKRTIIAKPMKGTMKRGKNIEDDRRNFKWLTHSEKNHAENTMIVDLLRNDLGKVCEYGSVTVEKTFEIETYETVFQMVSEVKGVLKKDCSFGGILQNLFPCGSITGAPKIRTMEIIHELEKEERGIYTGSIGLFLRDRAVFSVAIRTVEIDTATKHGSIGLGSGIVWDSVPSEEYQETLLKGSFLTEPQTYFEIFETCKIQEQKIFLFEQHMKRFTQTADFFLFCFDEKKVRHEIQKRINKINNDKKYKIKFSLDKSGDVRIEVSDFPTIPVKVRVIISGKRIDSSNKFQYFKTTHRQLYDEESKHFNSQDFFDIIFLNETGHIAEGAISNIFLRKGRKWLTPQISCGILSGVFREYFILKRRNVLECKLTIADLTFTDEIILTNSLRGIVKVHEVYSSEGKLIRRF